jgi:hypothetical protein
MINRTLARRLEQLEDFVLPTDAPQLCVRIHSMSSGGELVKTHVVKLGQVQPARVPARQSRFYGSLPRAR